jgi:hypothetical protein
VVPNNEFFLLSREVVVQYPGLTLQTGLERQPDSSFTNAHDVTLASSDVSQTSGYEAFQEHKPNYLTTPT